MSGSLAHQSEIAVVEAGSVIFRQGEPGDCAYLVEAGEVEIRTEGAAGRRIALRGVGELFGEMAIIDGGARSASAIALQTSRLLPVRAERLARYLDATDPVLRLVLDVLLVRLRETVGGPAPAEAPDAAASQAIMLKAVGRIRRENDFRRALAGGEIELFYQPIVSLPAEDVVGFEALARWRHPEFGMIAPADFIPLAEASGMIGALTRHCLELAAAAIPLFDRANPHASRPALFINVNVSGHDLVDRGFADMLGDYMARHPHMARRLKIEITESALMDDPRLALGTLERCRLLGIGVAIDDFGTGYSSLSYLHILPIDILKIDRSFVKGLSGDEQSAKIVRTIIRLAGELGIPVVSEGLEISEDVGALTRMGCDFGQGFHFARPMPLAEACRHLSHPVPAVRQVA